MQIKEIKLLTNHLLSLRIFYKDLLELETLEINSGSISVIIGSSVLIFEKTKSRENPFYHFAFDIPSNKIDEALAWLQNKVEILWIDDYKSYIADFSGWHAKSVYFIDPAGNIVEFIARFDLHDLTDEPFSSKQLRNISEIGIVYPATKYNDCVNSMLEKYHLTYFDKQPPMLQFRAIGDDEGLFIIVPEYRNWYPTNIPCGVFPLSIKFIDNNGQQQQLHS